MWKMLLLGNTRILREERRKYSVYRPFSSICTCTLFNPVKTAALHSALFKKYLRYLQPTTSYKNTRIKFNYQLKGVI